jgi:hypothetical protein
MIPYLQGERKHFCKKYLRYFCLFRTLGRKKRPANAFFAWYDEAPRHALPHEKAGVDIKRRAGA